MIAYALDSSGYLTGRSSVGADVSLLISALAMALLTAGVVLVLRRHYDAHRWVQTSAVVLNAVLVIVWMFRSLWLNVLPGIPGSLSKQGHALAAAHAVVGLAGTALGVFVVVKATQLTRRGKSVSRLKTAMRLSYLVYLGAFVLGVWLYVMTYG